MKKALWWFPFVAVAAVLAGYADFIPRKSNPARLSEPSRSTGGAYRPQPPVRITRRFAVPVLMYHRICDLSAQEKRSELARDLSVSPADFEEQVRYLKENGFTFLLASDVERAVNGGTPLPEKAVCLTMDDGYKDNFEQAFPILNRYGVPATIFLVTNTVDTERHLTWTDVNIMHREKIGFGSHTVHHYDLPGLSISQMDYELRESRRIIESRLVETISAVAYPSGRYSDTVIERARLAGYRAGWKKGGGPVQPGTDMFLLPRVRVNGDTSTKAFRRKVWSGVYAIAALRAEGRKKMAAGTAMTASIAE